MYIALMELQTQINELKSEVAQLKALLNGVYTASIESKTQINELKPEVAQLKAMLNGGNPSFNSIDCEELCIYPKKSESPDDHRCMTLGLGGFNGIQWTDREGVLRIELGIENYIHNPDESPASAEYYRENDGKASLHFKNETEDTLICVWTLPDGRGAGVVLPE